MIAPTIETLMRPATDHMNGQVMANEVKTDRLSLKSLRAGDLYDLMQVFSDKRLMPLSESEAAAYIERARLHSSAKMPIYGVRTEDDRLIGVVSLARYATGQGNLHMFGPTLGVSIAPEFQGMGYGTEAVKALVAQIARYGGHRILHAAHVADNEAASRVLVKAGFLYTGRRTIESDAASGDHEVLHMIRLL
ncbi:MAG: GNAT family N-acetyltransferase [Asticcacaulis sp.]